jgi:hypothetical protein
MKLCVIFLIYFLCLFANAADSIPTRKWTSIQGTTVMAKAHGISKEALILEKENGSIVNVPLNMLIEADQDLAREHFGVNPEAEQEKEDPKDDADADPKDDGDPKAVGEDKKIEQKDVNGSTIVLPYKLGSTTTDVEAERDLKINIYTPSTLRAGEKYAVMLLVDPKNGSHQQLTNFINAAETNEMIVVSLPNIDFATSPRKEQAKNWPKNKIYIDEQKLAAYVKDPLDKLFKDFSIDSKRIYVSGFGDQSYIAMWAMQRVDGAGCLCLNGGGRGEFNASNRDSLVMICSPGSKQRWDVATTFKNSTSSTNSFLIFGSKQSSQSDISEGVIALNAMFLLKRKAGTHEFIAERFEKEYIDFLSAMNLEEVSPWLDFTTRFIQKDEKNIKQLEEIRKEIMKDTTAIKAIEGHQDTLKILLRYFSDGWQVSEDENGTNATKNAVNKVKEKYKDTMWEPILTALSEKAN